MNDAIIPQTTAKVTACSIVTAALDVAIDECGQTLEQASATARSGPTTLVTQGAFRAMLPA
jgi:hypothetical protein